MRKEIERAGWLAALGCALSLNALAAPMAQPTAETIISNVIARAQWAQTQNFRGQFAYDRRRASEQLDERSVVKEREEKTYEVFPISGRPFSRLVKSDGKSLPERERKKEEERERSAREQAAQTKSPPAMKKELPLTQDVLGRFVFKVEGSELLNGRPMWVLAFTPKSGELPVKKIQDCVVNRISGRVWIDAAEFEIARAVLHMNGEVSLIGGLVGVLRQFDDTLERARVDDGVWFTTRSVAEIGGRELFRSKRVRLVEEAAGFRRVDQPGSTLLPVLR